MRRANIPIDNPDTKLRRFQREIQENPLASSFNTLPPKEKKSPAAFRRRASTKVREKH
jgi:hypothetical protein